MTTSSPPTELWVLLQSPPPTPGAINQAVLVSTQHCRFVTHFLRAIKNELSPALDAVALPNISLRASEDGPALEPDAALPAQNTKQTALLVTVPPPPSGPLFKAGRQKTLKKMSVEASCRKFLDAVAVKLSLYYNFPWKHRDGPTIGDVIHSVFPEERKRRKDGRPLWALILMETTHDTKLSNGDVIEIKEGPARTSVNSFFY